MAHFLALVDNYAGIPHGYLNSAKGKHYRRDYKKRKLPSDGSKMRQDENEEDKRAWLAKPRTMEPEVFLFLHRFCFILYRVERHDILFLSIAFSPKIRAEIM